MPKELPKPPPGLVMKMDQLRAGCDQLLDRYIAGFEIDMNRHAVKHGPMDPTEAHWHVTKILTQQVGLHDLSLEMLAGMVASAIVRGIAGKAKGRG